MAIEKLSKNYTFVVQYDPVKSHLAKIIVIKIGDTSKGKIFTISVPPSRGTEGITDHMNSLTDLLCQEAMKTAQPLTNEEKSLFENN